MHTAICETYVAYTGVESGPVVAEKEAAAAVAAAKEAARYQQEQALQHCSADWTARLGEPRSNICKRPTKGRHTLGTYTAIRDSTANSCLLHSRLYTYRTCHKHDKEALLTEYSMCCVNQSNTPLHLF